MRNIAVVSLCGLFMLAGTAFAQEPKAEPFVYDDHGKRDPLQPLVNPGGVIINYATDLLVTDLILEGIMVDAYKGNAAIINGRIVKAKDIIGTFVVLEIRLDAVILGKDDQKYEIRLKGGRK
ncbi:MAG: hypothetical protein Q7S13_06515 [Candidatus Omnitrophota bacterium]|nr:hypothetical protein [Candidatus Omnitrophota bacterium]